METKQRFYIHALLLFFVLCMVGFGTVASTVFVLGRVEGQGWLPAAGVSVFLASVGFLVALHLSRPVRRALHQSEERFFDLFEHAPDMLLSVSPDDDTIRESNSAFLARTGYGREEVLGRPFHTLCGPAAIDTVRRRQNLLLSDGSMEDFELDLLRKDGSSFPASINAVSVQDETGRAVAVRLSIRDITERRRTEATLKAQRDRAELYLNTAGVIMVALNARGRVEMINREGSELLGYDQAQLVGRDWFETALPPEFRAEVRKFHDDIVAGKTEPSAHNENPVLTAKGEERMVAWQNAYLRDSEGRITGSLSSGLDVTDLRESRAALRESEERFRILYNSVQAGVILQSATGEILHSNPLANEIFGMTANEVEGRTSEDPAWEMVDEAGRPIRGTDHPSMITLRTGEPIRGAVRGLFSGDPARTRWLLINTEPVFGEDPETRMEVVITFLDITARKRAEESLAESEARFRSLFEEAPLAYLSLDPEGRFLEVNQSFTDALGHRREDLKGRSFSEILTPESARLFATRFPAFKETGAVSGAEFHIVAKEGAVRIVSIDGRAHVGESGEFVRSHCILTDITEMRQAQDRLAQSEERLLLAQSVGRVGVLDRDLVEDTEVWSDTTFEILGLDPATAKPEPAAWMEAIHPDDRERAVRSLGRLLHGEDSEAEEYRVVHPDGTVRWVQGVARVFPSLHGAAAGRILATVHDITGLKRTEEALRASEEQFRASEERLRALADRLVQVREEERKAVARELHDELGQALTSLRMDLAMALSGLTGEKGRLRDGLTALIVSTDENIAFVQELSNRLRPSILDVMGLGPAVEWLVDDLRSRTPVRVHSEITTDYLLLSEDRRIAVYRIAQESLTNVVRHAHAENVWICLREEAESVVLEVSDDGQGLPSERLSSIHSLGLMGMQERALAIGAKLTVGARPGGGTSVQLVVLPTD